MTSRQSISKTTQKRMNLRNLSRLVLLTGRCSSSLSSSLVCASSVSSNLIRCFSKQSNKVNPKDLIRLYDQHDRPIGVKLKSEAEELAHKNHLDLVERNVRGQTKYKEFMLKSRIDELVQDSFKVVADDPNRTQQQTNDASRPTTTKINHHELKRLTFTASISEHDFEYRFQHIRRILHKNTQIRLFITGKPNGKEQLEKLYEKIQTRLGKEAKLTQKLFSDHSLKFTIQPTSEAIRTNHGAEEGSHHFVDEIPQEEEVIDCEEVEKLVKDLLKMKK